MTSAGKLAYSVNEALEAIGIKRSYFYQLVREGKIELRKLGGKSIVSAASLHRLIETAPIHDPSTTPQAARAKRVLADRRA